MRPPYTNPQRLRFVGVFLAGLSIFCVPTKRAGAQTETVLYTFTGLGDGGVPDAGLISDKQGNLYGTTLQYGDGSCTFPFSGCGTVFELSPVKDGGKLEWTFKLLYTFEGGSDGANPASDLVFDPAGNLYGTTSGGGTGCNGTGCGTVFELEKSESDWTEKVLYRFTGQSDGNSPVGSLTLDSRGNIYGTTAYGGDNSCYYDGPGCGVVFRLSHILSGQKTWRETVLHTFRRNRRRQFIRRSDLSSSQSVRSR